MSEPPSEQLQAAVDLLTEYAEKLPEGYVVELRASAYYGGIWVSYYDGDNEEEKPETLDHHGENWAAAVDVALADAKRRAQQ